MGALTADSYPLNQWRVASDQSVPAPETTETDGVMPWYALQHGGWAHTGAAPAATAVSARHALIVDGDRASARDVAQVLKGMGLEPLLATSAAEADVYYNQIKPALLALDLDLDGSNGLGLIRKIHAFASHKAKLLVISNGLPSQLAKARRAGAHATLPKPVDADSLRRAVRILLHN